MADFFRHNADESNLLEDSAEGLLAFRFPVNGPPMQTPEPKDVAAELSGKCYLYDRAAAQSLRSGPMAEHVEGRQSVFAALQARQRRIEVILVAHGAHVEKLQEILDLAAERGTAVRLVDRAELDSLAHSASHGGVIALCSPEPCLSGEMLVEFVETITGPPLLLLLEGVEDARNLGLRSAALRQWAFTRC